MDLRSQQEFKHPLDQTKKKDDPHTSSFNELVEQASPFLPPVWKTMTSRQRRKAGYPWNSDTLRDFIRSKS